MNAIVKKLITLAVSVKQTTPEIANERLEICNKCPLNREGKCKKCGCFIEIKVTLDYNKNPKKLGRLEKTHCPKGKWPFIDSEGIKHDNDKILADFYKD